jgi:pimeloyl-ACP methyl ester carboxylesterase
MMGWRPRAEAELMASRIPNAQLVVLDEASHLVLIENPREVADVIGKFLL